MRLAVSHALGTFFDDHYQDLDTQDQDLPSSDMRLGKMCPLDPYNEVSDRSKTLLLLRMDW